MRESRRTYQSFKPHSLANLARSLNLFWSGVYHRTLADAEMTGHLMLKVSQEIKYRSELDRIPFDVFLTLAEMPKHKVDDFWKKLRTEPVAHGY